MHINLADGSAFEREVRNIANKLWASSHYSGPILVDGRERDGIFITEETVHILEATISRNSSKAEQDLSKIAGLIEKIGRQYPDKAVKGWFITKDEPTAEQGAQISNYRGRITHQTYLQFYGRLIDSRNYIRLRQNYAFGSARDAVTNSFEIKSEEYVPVELISQRDSSRISDGSFQKLFAQSGSGARCLLLGEYGVGKSMFLRELFIRLAQSHERGADTAFPVYVNLRDHIEQYDPAECLTRHATKIGFDNPSHLVRAWRAGYVYLLLDGFDELTPRVITRDLKRARDIRRDALELVKRLIAETPSRSSVIVSGRTNFFDDQGDLKDCLGVDDQWNLYSLLDFDDRQIALYLSKRGHNLQLPAWLPRRPLLVSYMIGQHLIQEEPQSSDVEPNPAKGWNFLIDRICDREVNQVYLALSKDELRSIYGRIATKCRKKVSNLGPLTFQDCKDAFAEVVQVEPEGRSLTALLRLPGLIGGQVTSDNAKLQIEAGSRWFVDEDFANAIASVDLANFVTSPDVAQMSKFDGVIHNLTETGIAVALDRSGEVERVHGLIVGALERAANHEASNPVIIDLIQALNDLGGASGSRMIVVTDQSVQKMRFDSEDADLRNVVITNSYVDEIFISTGDLEKLPRFSSCAIERIRTHLPRSDLSLVFDNRCVIENVLPVYENLTAFREAVTDDRLIALSSVLDKLFVQSRSGRTEGALRRGLDPKQSLYVSDVLNILRRHRAIYASPRGAKGVVFPAKAFYADAVSILKNPDASDHALIKEVLDL
jgi:hypothetical protein